MQLPFRDITVGALLARVAARVAQQPVLLYPAAPRYSFADLEREARIVGRGLMAAGVSPGERVVVWATNVPEWVVLQFALAKIGAVLVTANTALTARDIDYLIRQSQAATLITIRGVKGLDYVDALETIGATRGNIPGLQRLIFVGPNPPPGFMAYEDLRSRADQIAEGDLDRRAAAVAVDDVINMQY